MKQFISILICALGASSAIGQAQMPLSHSNSLGLPLIPQAPPNATPQGTGSAAATAARKEAPVAAVKPNPKASLSGPVSMASYYEADGVTRVRVTTGNNYPAGEARKTALAGALQMQRDVALSCGKRCKALAAPAPVVLASGQLQLDILIRGLDRKLSGADMVLLVKGMPLAESTAEEKLSLAPPVAIGVNKISVAAPVPAAVTTPTAASPTTAP